MLTIELIGDKSAVSFDLESAPRQAFVRYQGRLYHQTNPAKLVWNLVDGDLPTGASVFTLNLDGTVDVANTTAIDPPAPTAPPVEPTPAPEPPHDASADHS